MVEERRDCIDVLTQIKAEWDARGKVETEMLRDHLSHSVDS